MKNYLLTILFSISMLVSCDHMKPSDGKTKVSENEPNLVKDIESQNHWRGRRINNPAGGARVSVYYDSSVNAEYRSIFDNARMKWTGISSNISFKTVTTKPGLPNYHDIYKVDNVESPYFYAKTTLYRLGAGGRRIPLSDKETHKDWRKADITMYAGSMKNFSRQEKITTAAHEIGHTLTLAHQDDHTAIHRPLKSGERTIMETGQFVLDPQPYDKREVKEIWGR